MKQFQAESKKLLDMMINSIYTNRDIFMRELISNASDALDKLYIKQLQDEALDFSKDSFHIEIIPDKALRTLTIRDTGIGMTRDELENNLGTIAHSGSLAFKRENAQTPEMGIIGQFGVGFYSAFMVADRIVVETKAFGEEAGYRWTSEGAEGYEIEAIDREAAGTSVTLHLKPNAEDEDYDRYLEEYTIRELVKRYSNYIRYPIRMTVTRQKRIEPTEEGQAPTFETEAQVEQLNSMTPIWNKSKQELKDEDYVEFYHQERFGFDEPLLWSHLVADGTLSYRAILYIPGTVPFDYYTQDYKKGLALYSEGVKIMDKAEDLLPDHYSFVKGVVSSEDLTLNLSRETLQQNRQLLAIAKKLEAKITDELRKLLESDRDTYERFYAQFGVQLKGGIYQSYGMKKDELAPLLIFDTSKGEGKRTLSEITKEMVTGEDEKRLYYVTGESAEQIAKLPVLRKLKDRGIEVIFLTEAIDEFAIKAMSDFDGFHFKSILADDFDLGDDPRSDGEPEAAEAASDEALFSAMKAALGDAVISVRRSNRLVDDAVVLVAQGEISLEMEKAFSAQPHGRDLKAQKILEINARHPIFSKLSTLQASGENEALEDYTRLLYDQARLIAGLPIEDAVGFAQRVQKLMA